MHRLFIAAALLLSACGSSSQTKGANSTTVDSNASAGPGSDVECHDEKPLGSSVPRRVCETKQDRDLDHQGAQDWHSHTPATPTMAR